MNIFDPIEGADYGLCADCGMKLPTQDEARAHMRITFEEATPQGHSKGHRVRILNPDRASRIKSRVSSMVDDAIQDAMEEIYRLVERDQASTEEITEALSWHSDFADAWQEYAEGSNA